jgi:hypothetical protein
MERNSGRVTAAFHGCRSAVEADLVPVDGWFSGHENGAEAVVLVPARG